jgi:hypothetical protein
MTFLVAASVSASTEDVLSLLFWATLGGIAVAVGLIIEKVADWMNERYLGESYKPHKGLENVGWCILMAGIFIEIIAAGSSAKDAWQLKIAENKLEQQTSEARDRIADIQVAALPAKIVMQQLVDSLRTIPGISVHLSACANPSQATLLAIAFQNAKWGCTIDKLTNSSIFWFGIDIAYNSGPDGAASKNAAFVLRDELRSMGFVAICLKESEPPDTISVRFGETPGVGMARMVRLHEQIDQETNAVHKAHLEKTMQELFGRPARRLEPTELK